jgi:sugar phosphate isomerase/epimerase
MKISMGAWSFTFGPHAATPKLLDQICERLAKAGYEGIELCGFTPHVTLEAYPGAVERAQLRRMLSGYGLGISSYSADLTPVNPLVRENRERYLERFRRLLDLCADIGSPSIRIDTVAAPGSLSESEYHLAFHHLADLWRECAELGRQAQVTLVWEFEPGFVFNKPSEVVALHDQVGHPWFQLVFDTAHAYLCSVVAARQHGRKETLPGGINEFLDLLQGRIGSVHVVDTDGSLYSDETSTHRPFHAGIIPWRAVMPKLLAVCPLDWWCVDLSFYPEAWDSVESSLADLKKLIADAGRG